jgi:hypothetical protein
MKSLLLYAFCPAGVKLAELGITGTLARRVRVLPLAALPAPRPQRLRSLRQERDELRQDIKTIGWALQQYRSGARLPDAGHENGLQADLDASISRLRAVEATLRALEGGGPPGVAIPTPR